MVAVSTNYSSTFSILIEEGKKMALKEKEMACLPPDEDTYDDNKLRSLSFTMFPLTGADELVKIRNHARLMKDEGGPLQYVFGPRVLMLGYDGKLIVRAVEDCRSHRVYPDFTCKLLNPAEMKFACPEIKVVHGKKEPLTTPAPKPAESVVSPLPGPSLFPKPAESVQVKSTSENLAGPSFFGNLPNLGTAPNKTTGTTAPSLFGSQLKPEVPKVEEKKENEAPKPIVKSVFDPKNNPFNFDGQQPQKKVEENKDKDPIGSKLDRNESRESNSVGEPMMSRGMQKSETKKKLEVIQPPQPKEKSSPMVAALLEKIKQEPKGKELCVLPDFVELTKILAGIEGSIFKRAGAAPSLREVEAEIPEEKEVEERLKGHKAALERKHKEVHRLLEKQEFQRSILEIQTRPGVHSEPLRTESVVDRLDSSNRVLYSRLRNTQRALVSTQTAFKHLLTSLNHHEGLNSGIDENRREDIERSKHSKPGCLGIKDMKKNLLGSSSAGRTHLDQLRNAEQYRQSESTNSYSGQNGRLIFNTERVENPATQRKPALQGIEAPRVKLERSWSVQARLLEFFEKYRKDKIMEISGIEATILDVESKRKGRFGISLDFSKLEEELEEESDGLNYSQFQRVFKVSQEIELLNKLRNKKLKVARYFDYSLKKQIEELKKAKEDSSNAKKQEATQVPVAKKKDEKPNVLPDSMGGIFGSKPEAKKEEKKVEEPPKPKAPEDKKPASGLFASVNPLSKVGEEKPVAEPKPLVKTESKQVDPKREEVDPTKKDKEEKEEEGAPNKMKAGQTFAPSPFGQSGGIFGPTKEKERDAPPAPMKKPESSLMFDSMAPLPGDKAQPKANAPAVEPNPTPVPTKPAENQKPATISMFGTSGEKKDEKPSTLGLGGMFGTISKPTAGPDVQGTSNNTGGLFKSSNEAPKEPGFMKGAVADNLFKSNAPSQPENKAESKTSNLFGQTPQSGGMFGTQGLPTQPATKPVESTPKPVLNNTMTGAEQPKPQGLFGDVKPSPMAQQTAPTQIGQTPSTTGYGFQNSGNLPKPSSEGMPSNGLFSAPQNTGFLAQPKASELNIPQSGMGGLFAPNAPAQHKPQLGQTSSFSNISKPAPMGGMGAPGFGSAGGFSTSGFGSQGFGANLGNPQPQNNLSGNPAGGSLFGQGLNLSSSPVTNNFASAGMNKPRTGN